MLEKNKYNNQHNNTTTSHITKYIRNKYKLWRVKRYDKTVLNLTTIYKPSIHTRDCPSIGAVYEIPQAFKLSQFIR